MLAAASVCCKPKEIDLTGTWTQPVPGQAGGWSQGMQLNADGTASSVNMYTLVLESWEKRRQRHQHRFHRYPDHRPEKHGRLAFPPTGNECPGFRQTAPINPQTDTDEHERCPAEPDRCILHTPFTTVCHSSGQHSINPSAMTESDIFPIRTTSSHADKDSLKQAL